MADFKDKIRQIIREVVGPDVPDRTLENDPIGTYADEEKVGDIQGEIEEEFEVVFDEDDLETLDELTLEGLVTRVTDLGGKLQE